MKLFNIRKGNAGPNSTDTKYIEAVSAILSIVTVSSDKDEMLNLLKTDGDASYYRAIIRVAESDMYSGDIIKAIKIINEI